MIKIMQSYTKYNATIFQNLIILIWHLSLCFNVQGVKLQCNMKKYDLDSDSLVSREEFLTVTHGFKEMDPNVLFDRLDTNGLLNFIYCIIDFICCVIYNHFYIGKCIFLQKLWNIYNVHETKMGQEKQGYNHTIIPEKNITAPKNPIEICQCFCKYDKTDMIIQNAKIICKFDSVADARCWIKFFIWCFNRKVI